MAQTTAAAGFLVGLLGESPNDTASLQALLGRRYGARVRFVVISPDITGAQLDSPKFQHIIRVNYRIKNPAVVVITRDLDAPATDRQQRLKRLLFFRKLNKGMDLKAVFLLHVQAMEALIAADIAVFNHRYQCVCTVPADPTTIIDPARFLKNATPFGKPGYSEGHCASLLQEVRYEELLAKCSYFAAFDADFARRLPALP